MKKSAMIALVFAAVLALVGFSLWQLGVFREAQQEPLKIGWSVWVGWMPWYIVQEEGLLKKHGANAELVFFPNYLDSQTAFASQQLDASSLTINDALVPLSKGVQAKVVLVNDVSNGGDGVISRGSIRSLQDLSGETVSLELGSVSHFLLLKGLETAGVNPDTVEVNNTPGDLAGTAFIGNQDIRAVATWNPFLAQAREEGANLLFDSSMIYGQISDLLLVQDKVIRERPEDVRAVLAAWFEAVEMIRNPETRERAIAIMAVGANMKPTEFEVLLSGTDLFLTPERSVEFMGAPEAPGPLVGHTRSVGDFLLRYEFIGAPVEVRNLFDSSFVRSFIVE